MGVFIMDFTFGNLGEFVNFFTINSLEQWQLLLFTEDYKISCQCYYLWIYSDINFIEIIYT